MTTGSIPRKAVKQIYRDKEQPQGKETASLEAVLAIRDNVRAPIQRQRERQTQHLKR